MMQDLEILDIVDESDCVIGQKKRSEIYSQGLCNFRVVNSFVVNSLGKLWIPRRSAQNEFFPFVLMSAWVVMWKVEKLTKMLCNVNSKKN